MRRAIEKLGMKVLFGFDAETAHGLSVAALKTGLTPVLACPADPRLAVDVAGLHFPNPLGMAAGYDKNAEVPDALLRLGFGFVEVGTVTPKPQPGNPRPRIFRLPADRGVINRLGFNNEGHEACVQRLRARAGRPGIVGVNIGANKDSADRIADYVAGVQTFASLASYLTINISSPNTPGLRALQDRDSLRDLLGRVIEARDTASTERKVPVFLKVAPDLNETEIDDITAAVLDLRADGLIVSNTTLSRDGLRDARTAAETGGLSGRPLFAKSTRVLAKFRKRVGADLPIIGVGGVESAETMLEKIRAGADLVQLYSCMIYEGPLLPGRIIREAPALLDREKASTVRELRDRKVDHWAGQEI